MSDSYRYGWVCSQLIALENLKLLMLVGKLRMVRNDDDVVGT